MEAQWNDNWFDGGEDRGAPGGVLQTDRQLTASEHDQLQVSWAERHRHCYDAEKCNADTFCDCICKRCMGVKRGEYQTR